MVKKLNAFRLSPDLESVLDDEAVNSSKTAAIESLVADGLKYRMLNHHRPVSKKFIERLGNDGIFRLYACFVNAVCGELRLEPKYDLPVKYRFEPTPKQSKFYVPGQETFLILSEMELVNGAGQIVRIID